MMVRLVFGLAVLMAAGAVQAQDQAAPAKPEPAKKERTFCRRDETSGTRMAKSTCHTKAEWVAIDAGNDGARDKAADQRRMMK